MKFKYDESFLFPQSQEDFGRGLMFPQGQLSGSFEKTVYQNRFLFPAGGTDTDRGETLMFPQGKLHGLGAVDIVKVNLPSWGSTPLYLKEAEQAAGLPRYPNLPVQSNGLILRSDLMKAQIAENPSLADNPDVVSVLNELLAAQASMGIVSQAAAPVAQQAAVAVATATQQAQDVANIQAARASADAFQAQQAAEAAAAKAAAEAAAAAAAAAAAREPVSLTLDVLSDGTAVLIGKLKDGTSIEVARGSSVDPWLSSRSKTRDSAGQTAAYVKTVQAAAAAADTHKTAVDTSTATVQHVDTASGTTSTVNAATGAVTVTTPSGATATGKGTVTAGGVTTTVDTKTGVVTTQNTATGVATQTNAATGQTQTAVQVTGTAATGGTFMLPGGATVTTTQPITATGLSSGHIALAALLGVLLLRGAVR